jgi:hypothetical protein
MKAIRLIAAALASLAAVDVYAQSELQTYVGRCQNELQFSASQVPDTIDCTQGKLFDLSFTTPINDRVVYHRVTDKVDLVAACRWGNTRFLAQPKDTAFISMELIIHNRDTGGTCFFAAKDVLTGDAAIRPIPAPIAAPTNFKPVPGEPGKLLADKFWMQPTDLNNKKLPTDPEHTPSKYGFIRCVGCHSQGPYIASKAIARDLAGYGLLNDGHDTRTNFAASKHYYVVGSSPHTTDPATDTNTHAFREWNRIISRNNIPECGNSCHMLAANSTAGPIFDPQPGNVTRVLPSIAQDIAEYAISGMPPYDDASEIRWMNLATPWASGIEVETFERAKDSNNGTASSSILSNCAVPGEAEAIAVGMRRERFFDDPDGGPLPPPWDDTVFSTAEMKLLPNRLNTFNLKEGVLCLNSEQAPGRTCVNYQTSYLCDDKWTDETLGFWFDTDTPSTSGDHEQRSRVAGLCANPTGIKTRFQQGANYVVVHGPTDRLAQFNKQRLACNNADQIDGKCSNYVVRYRTCASGSLPGANGVRSVWSSRLLTASAASNGAQVRGQPSNAGWNTQRWMVEDEVNTPYVRLRNTGTNTYLNVRGQEESAVVETYEIRDWDSQRWVREAIPGSSEVRFRNVWSGKYLTLRDTTDYSAVYSQTLSNQNWPSQRWAIQ